MQIAPDVIAAAQAAEAKWKIPASVQLAQYGLESGWGAHMPAGSNNPFGIKANDRRSIGTALAATHEFVAGRYIAVSQPFAEFRSIADAFDAHAELLATSHYYAPARSKLPDVDAFCNALTGVYATDPQYGGHLINLIELDHLEQYDAPPAVPELAPMPNVPATPAQSPMAAAAAAAAALSQLGSQPATKPVMASQTVHGGLSASTGGLIVMLGQLLPQLGFTDAQDAKIVAAASAVITIIGAAGAVYGGIVAIIGRFRATTTLT